MTVEPTPDDVRRLLEEDDGRPVVMLNLLRYAGEEGRESYRRYGAAVLPLLQGVGAEVLYAGAVSTTLVDPGDERWDELLLVRYPSRGAFLEMVSSPAYGEIAHLRRDGLEAAVLQATTPLG